MITVLDGFQCKLDKNHNRDIWTIYSYEPISIDLCNFKAIYLPYKRLNIDKLAFFQLNKNLVEKGLIVQYNNLNEESSLNNLQFIFWNLNMEKNISHLEHIIGAKNLIKIRPGEELGKIFC